MDLQQKLDELPKSSGVYMFRGQNGEILYVGKARTLKSRVRSYFQEARVDSPRLDRLVERIRDVEVVVTDTEREALVLENLEIEVTHGIQRQPAACRRQLALHHQVAEIGVHLARLERVW